MSYEDLNSATTINTKHSTISLANLIEDYFNVDSHVKNEIHSKMSTDPYIWKRVPIYSYYQRPLNNILLEYAAYDVLYLPMIYDKIKKKCESGEYSSLNFQKIMLECDKYIEYSKINLKIKNFHKINLAKDTIVEGLLKYSPQ